MLDNGNNLYNKVNPLILEEEIVNTLGRLEPRITVSQVNVNIDDDYNLEVEVEYVIIGERITQTVDFLLERT